MGYGPVTGRCHVDLARIGLGVDDKFQDRLGGNRRIDHHDIRAAANARDRSDVSYEIEIELLVKRRVYCARQAGKQKRVAVRWRAHDRLSADIAACTCPVLNNECLPKPLRQRLTHEARDAVGRLAGRKGNYDAPRPRRIALPPCIPRYDRENSTTPCQMQKSSTREFHRIPPSVVAL